LQQMTAIINGVRLFFVAWMDRKPVHLLSTIPSSISYCFRQIKQGATWVRTRVILPAIIKVYNAFMGGTDGFDWRVALFRPKIITKSWVPKVFIHLVGSAVVNAYLIFKWHHGITLGNENYRGKKYPHREFIENLMISLAEDHLHAKRPQGAVEREIGRNSRSKQECNADPYRTTGLHWPTQTLLEANDREKDDNKLKRSNCMMCHRKVGTRCKQCGVYLCLDAKAGSLNCWEQFHTAPDIR